MIELRKIDEDNWHQIIKLEVREDQKDFVASNIYSLAESYIELSGDIMPFMTLAVYHGDVPVGFAKVEYQDDDDSEYGPYYWMCRFMIDKNHQGKGYGKQAMTKILEHIRTFPLGSAAVMALSYKPDNDFVRGFYKSFGFEETGDFLDDEVIAKLSL